MGAASNINAAQKTFGAMAVLAIMALVVLILFGNLSGNLGFASGSQGETDTNNVINNVTGGVVTYFSFAGTWFTLLAVTLLIIIVMSVMGVVRSRGGGFSS